MNSSDRRSVYERITQEVIDAIEAGPGEIVMPWHHDGSTASRPINAVTGKPYRGINTLALWAAGCGLEFETGLWATYRQWAELGAQVRKGARGSNIVFWKPLDPRAGEDSADFEGDARRSFIARGYCVFNADQVEGFEFPVHEPLSELERNASADAFLGALDIDIRYVESSAYYRPSTDTVHLPEFERFRDAASFYAVAIHECGHASGAKHRLDRDLMSRFGTATYAAEEISVELASGFVLADLAIAHHPRSDHASYIESWLDLLKDDPRAIFTAASKAQQIADWMWTQQSKAEPPG